MAGWDADRLVAEVQRLGIRSLPRDRYFEELGARLRRTLPIDAACWHGLDPRTLLLTTANPVELVERGFLSEQTEPVAARSVIASEYQREDYNTFAGLARRRAPVGILSEACRGRPERSARYREFLAPSGTPFELRAAMVTRGRAWACVVLHRTAATGDFQPAEARLMARLSRPIANGVRASLLRDAALRSEDEGAPGMILLGPRDELELITPPAERFVELLREESSSSSTLPPPILAAAASARRRPADAVEGVTLHVPSGIGWLTLYASYPQGVRSGRVAIVIQLTKGETASALRLEAHGLTSREQEVAALAAHGLTTEALAERLFLSPWTVQDHLKSIFDKTGTHSRRQLRAQIFHETYLPAIARQSPLDANGSPVPQ
ncbi:helix-turn-helix domain-containing protein [Kribbella sp. CA-294648]|uniref:helix-turn-helix domain-containing protein n=1 Tax=Kribbella sp. CA-294648 TaxID=3239948 RepID=UPI003D8B904F